MIKVLAIDDEPLALQQLVAYIGKVPFLQLTGQCQSALEAMDLLNREPVDAIFCDINMPDLSGMDFVKSLTVPPLMFITFVENAFKHGISYRQASFIDIDISTEGGKLVFICRNSKAPREEDKQGGVGLQNIKQRLELIYGKNYTLDIDEQSETYNIKLVLPLEK